MNKEVTIEKLKDDDVEEASRLIRDIILNTPYYTNESKTEMVKEYSAEKINFRMNDGQFYHPYIIAKVDGVIAGFIDGYADAGVFWGNWLGVHPDYRRQGISAKLITALESDARKNGCHKYWCDTRTDNLESIALQEKLGYQKIGTLKNYWFHMDFYIWDKDL